MAEPVSLADAKKHLRVLHSDEDAHIGALIVAAREYVELTTDHILTRRAFVLTLTDMPCYVRIPQQPLMAVDGITYIDANGDDQTFTDFRVNLAQGRIYPLAAWPSFGTGGYAAINFQAGYADGAAPQHLLQVMLLLIGHWYANREAVGSVTGEMALSVTALCGRSMVPLA